MNPLNSPSPFQEEPNWSANSCLLRIFILLILPLGMMCALTLYLLSPELQGQVYDFWQIEIEPQLADLLTPEPTVTRTPTRTRVPSLTFAPSRTPITATRFPCAFAFDREACLFGDRFFGMGDSVEETLILGKCGRSSKKKPSPTVRSQLSM